MRLWKRAFFRQRELLEEAERVAQEAQARERHAWEELRQARQDADELAAEVHRLRQEAAEVWSEPPWEPS